jgi:hypothetical protein
MTDSGVSMQAIRVTIISREVDLGSRMHRELARAGEDAPFGKLRAGSATTGGTPALRLRG